MSKGLYYSFIFFLISICFLRVVLSQSKTVLPKSGEVNFLANIGSEPKISAGKQVIKVENVQIYADLYPRYRVGDRIKVSGKISDRGTISFPKIEKVGENRGSLAIFSNVKRKVSERIFQLMPNREATLVAGTVLGIDSIDSEFKNILVKTGTIHVVVVSGENLVLVAGVFMALAAYFGRKRSLVLATLAVFLYALLSGFNPPVVRACLMVLVSTIAVFIGREIDPLWNLFLAALIIIFIWPQSLSEISFQLTFAASLGIITLGKHLIGFFEKLPFFGQNAAITIAAYVLTAPVILYYFGQVSPIAPFANLVVSFSVFPIMVLGFLTAVASLIFMPLAQVFAYLAFIPAFYFVKMTEFFAGLPLAQVTFKSGNLAAVLVIYAVVFLFILTRKTKKVSKV